MLYMFVSLFICNTNSCIPYLASATLERLQSARRDCVTGALQGKSRSKFSANFARLGFKFLRKI